MSSTNPAVARRLQRLERVLEGRRARLAATLERRRRPAAQRGPLANLQQHGYTVALVLAATAVLPAVIAIAAKKRKPLFVAATAGVRARRWRNQVDTEPPSWGNP